MLSIGLNQAQEFSKNPILIARDINNEKKNLYWVEDSALPCQNCDKNPLSMLDSKQIWKLRRKYKISTKVMKKIEQCYKNPTSDHVDIGKAGESLDCRLFLREIEDDIISSLKTEVRLDKNTRFVPFFDENALRENNYHATYSGPSNSGKTTIAAKVIQNNFENAITFVFAPMATRSRIWTQLRKDLGKKHIKLIDSGQISVPISLHEIAGKSTPVVIVIDDADSMHPPRSRMLIQNLATEALFHGRHLNCTVQQINHDSFSRKLGSTKAQAVESSRIFVFPNVSRHVCTKMLKARLGMSKKVIDGIYKWLVPSDRWMMIKLDHPTLVLTATGCKLLS